MAGALVALTVVVAWVAGQDTADLVRAVVGAVLAYVVLRGCCGSSTHAGMGYGDVRLSAVLGGALGYLGWGPLFVGLYAGFLIFGLPGLLLALVRRDRRLLRTALPVRPVHARGRPDRGAVGHRPVGASHGGMTPSGSSHLP